MEMDYNLNFIFFFFEFFLCILELKLLKTYLQFVLHWKSHLIFSSRGSTNNQFSYVLCFLGMTFGMGV